MPPVISVASFKYLSLAENPAQNDGAFVDSTYMLSFSGMYSTASIQQEFYSYTLNVRSPSFDEFVIDSLGNIYTIVSARVIGGYGQYDLLVTKIHNDGSIAWCKTFGTAMTEVPGAITIDQSDNVYISYGVLAVDTGGAWPNALRISKLDPAGNTLWAKQYTYSTQIIWPDSMAVSASGLYIGLRLNTTGWAHLLKCSLNGDILWCKESYASTRGGSTQTPVVVDGSGDAYFASPSSAGVPFLAKYAANGTQSWVRNLSAGGMIAHMCRDSSGNILAAGGDESSNALIIKFAADGTVLWSRSLKRTSFTHGARHVCVDAAGNVYIVGTCLPTANPKYPAAFIAKFSSDGTALWQRVTTYPTCTTLCAKIGADGLLYVAVTLNARNSGSETYTSTYRTNTWPGEYSKPALLKMRPDGTLDSATSSLSISTVAMTITSLTLSASTASYTSAPSASSLTADSRAVQSTDLPFNAPVTIGTKTSVSSRAIGFVCNDTSGNMYVASVAYGSGAVFQKYSTAGNVLWGFSTLTTVQPIGMVCNDSNLYILYSGVGSSSQNLHIVGYSGSTAEVLFTKSLVPGQSMPPTTGQYTLHLVDNHLVVFQTVTLSYTFIHLLDVDLSTNGTTAAYKTSNAHTAIGVLGDQSGNRHLFMLSVGNTTVWRTSSASYLTATSSTAYQKLVATFVCAYQDVVYMTGYTLDTTSTPSEQTPFLAVFSYDRTLLWAKTYDFGPASAAHGLVKTGSNIWLSIQNGLLKLSLTGEAVAFYPIPAYGQLSILGNSIRVARVGEPIFDFDLDQLSAIEAQAPCSTADYTPTVGSYTSGTWAAESWSIGTTMYSTISNTPMLNTVDVHTGIISTLE